MKILALDTALGACSVAVLVGDQVLSHRWVAMERGHAEALAPMVQAVIRDSGIPLRSIDRIAVTVGPGTFTGQRVGLAFARGLRVALKKPLVGLTTLEVIAVAASAETGISSVAVVHDARRNEVYFALVRDGVSASDPQVTDLPGAAAAILNQRGAGPIAIAGTAAPQLAALLATANPKLNVVQSAIRQPDALWLARLAAQRPASDATPAPLYLRAPDAKLPAPA